jgi:hypothetical protein
MRWFKLEVTKNLDLLPPGVASSTAFAPNERGEHLRNPRTMSARLPERSLARLAYHDGPKHVRNGETKSESSLALLYTQEAGVIEHRALLRRFTDRVERKVDNHDP